MYRRVVRGRAEVQHRHRAAAAVRIAEPPLDMREHAGLRNPEVLSQFSAISSHPFEHVCQIHPPLVADGGKQPTQHRKTVPQVCAAVGQVIVTPGQVTIGARPGGVGAGSDRQHDGGPGTTGIGEVGAEG